MQSSSYLHTPIKSIKIKAKNHSMCCFLDDSDSEMSDMELLDEAELGGFISPEEDKQFSVHRYGIILVNVPPVIT
jgi:hypothetical protein